MSFRMLSLLAIAIGLGRLALFLRHVLSSSPRAPKTPLPPADHQKHRKTRSSASSPSRPASARRSGPPSSVARLAFSHLAETSFAPILTLSKLLPMAIHPGRTLLATDPPFLASSLFSSFSHQASCFTRPARTRSWRI